jgi:PKD repeat protein
LVARHFTPTLANTSYGSPTTFLWNFGNGQTSAQQSPVAPTYVNTTRRDSVYTLSLKVTNVCGTDSVKKSITVKANDVFAKILHKYKPGLPTLNR